MEKNFFNKQMHFQICSVIWAQSYFICEVDSYIYRESEIILITNTGPRFCLFWCTFQVFFSFSVAFIWKLLTETYVQVGLWNRVNHSPLNFFFAKRYIWRLPGYTWVKKDTSGTLFRLFRCIRQLPGVSRCIQVYPKQKISGRMPKNFFFDRVSQPPLRDVAESKLLGGRASLIQWNA